MVPQNLTDQFTIATWMKHGPSPGLRAEKETILCNSDKTGGEILSHYAKVLKLDMTLIFIPPQRAQCFPSLLLEASNINKIPYKKIEQLGSECVAQAQVLYNFSAYFSVKYIIKHFDNEDHLNFLTDGLFA